MQDAADLPFLPYGRQSIDDEDIETVIGTLRSDFLTTGPMVPAFERALCNYTKARFSTACTSGTAALHLALMALKSTGRLKDGDAVIVPSMTFLATANCIHQVGSIPVFADCDPDTGLMELAHLEEALLHASDLDLRVKGIIPVHMNGQTADMASLQILADPHDLFMVEDAAHAIGTRVGDQHVGAVSDMTCFSFHPVKSMTMAEGGAVTTDDPDLYTALKRLRNHGMIREAAHMSDPTAAEDPWVYEMQEPGLNYRATDLQCALGLSQLQKLDGFITRRQEIVDHYDRAFADLEHARPITRRDNSLTAWHLYPLLIDFSALGKPRRQVMAELKDRGIGTQVHYIPVHTQPFYRRTCSTPDLPGTRAYYDRALSIPLYPDLTDEDVNRVITTVFQVIA